MNEIIIEPGMHPLDEKADKKQLAEVSAGNIDSHSWNGAVAKRIAEYKPKIVAIDSLEPYAPDEVSIDYKKIIWSSLPASPRELNGTDEMLVVAGDNTYGFMGNAVSGAEMMTRVGLLYGGYKLGQSLLEKPIWPNKIKDDRSVNATYNHAVEGEWKDQVEREDREAEYDRATSLAMKQMSRRNFMGSAGLAFAGVAVLSPFIAAYSPFNFVTNIANSVSDIKSEAELAKLTNKEEYALLSGRNAILISKLKDSIDRLHLGDRIKAPVILGNAHIDGFSDLVKDPKLRDSHIRERGLILADKAREDTKFFGDDYSVDSRAEWIIGHEKNVKIYKVSQPDPEAFKADSKAEIDRVVEMVDDFDAPSVINSLQGVLDIPRS